MLDRLLIELQLNQLIDIKYIIMSYLIVPATAQGNNQIMTKKPKLLTNLLPKILFALSLVIASATPAFADELKDISQMAEQGQQAAALDRVNAYLVKNPKDAQAMFMKGVFLVEQGRRDEATKAFVDLTEKYPNLPEPYNNLAVLYADAGQYDKAQKALETAIRTHPSYATAHENLGDLYARRASEAYDKALQLDNGNTRAQSKLALIKELFGPNTKLAAVATKATAATAQTKDNAKTSVIPVKLAETAKADVTTKSDMKTVATEAAVEDAAAKATSNSVDNSPITDTVDAWAKAWSAKNVDKYLASYSSSFKTPKGESRKEWEQARRERIRRPASIKVEVSDLKVTMQSSNMAKVSFKQAYRANGNPQYTTKTLIMKKVGDSWLIDQESTGY